LITFLRRALPLLDRRARRGVFAAAGLMMVLAAMEATALLLIAPLMSILTSPGLVSTSRFVTFLSGLLGHPTPGRLALDLGLATVVLYLVKSVASVLTFRWAMGFCLREEARLVRRLMHGYLTTPYREHLRVNSSQRVRTLTVAIRSIFQSGFTATLSALGDTFSIVLIAAILVVANPVIAAAAGLYFGLVTLVYQRLTNRVLTRRVQKLHRDQATDFNNISESLRAVKEIQIRGAEERFADTVYHLREGLIPSYRSMALVSSTPRYILELAMVGAAATIAAIAYSTESTTSATAALGLFLVGGFRIVSPLNKIIFGNAQAKAAMPGVEQVWGDLAVTASGPEAPAPSRPADAAGRLDPIAGPPTVIEPPAAGPDVARGGASRVGGDQHRVGGLPRVRLEEVRFSYDPGVPVLDGISFEISPGESVGLVGGTGAGKSTLLDLLLGVLEPDAGRILIDGCPLGDVKRHWQDLIGYVPQTSVIFDDTIRANVAFGQPRDLVSDDQVWDALRQAQFEQEVRTLEQGLDTMVGEAGTRLSGGQRQRLGVARALYGRPHVLLLDEATSALDNETEHRLSQVLEALRGQMTMVTIAHRLSTVRRCDRVLYLEAGRLVAQGSFSELNASIPGFARLVELSSLEV
jgi:ABC-type multidrug transport system fused ATPase/permease subunit